MLQKLLGINYRTTILGIGVIVAAVGRIVVAWRTKDFEAIVADGQLVLQTVIAILAGLGLFIAKDANVTGTGAVAKSVDSAGTLTNVEGKVVGHQSTEPAKP